MTPTTRYIPYDDLLQILIYNLITLIYQLIQAIIQKKNLTRV